MLTALAQKRQRHPTRLGHLHLVLDLAQFLHEFVRQDRILNTVLGHLPELGRVSILVPSENLLDRHVEFLSVAEKPFGNVIQRVTLQLVLALHILEKIENVPAFHRHHLELVVP